MEALFVDGQKRAFLGKLSGTAFWQRCDAHLAPIERDNRALLVDLNVQLPVVDDRIQTRLNRCATSVLHPHSALKGLVVDRFNPNLVRSFRQRQILYSPTSDDDAIDRDLKVFW